MDGIPYRILKSEYAYGRLSMTKKMQKLCPSESELTGAWIVGGKSVRADAICERIEWLVTNVLDQLAHSKEWGAWETLFRDPEDGRLWERTYPQSEMHGGGSPTLRLVSREVAAQKYDLDRL